MPKRPPSATRIRVDIDTKDDFYAFFTPKNPARARNPRRLRRSHWCGSRECEEQIKKT